jgi:peptide subunit release factor 1 (eRF1)
MLQDIDLRELANLRGNGRDFVSIYFRTEDGLDSLKSRERTLRALLEDDPDEAEHFDMTMARIRAVLEENPTSAEGMCIFGCALLDFIRGFPVGMPVPGEMHVSDSPYIRPLAELQEEYQTFAVVACDNDSTRIYLVTNRTAEVEEQIRGGVKNHVRKGGWSQKRYSRRRDQQLRQYAKEVADVLTSLTDRSGIGRIVLLGSEETMLAIEQELPERVGRNVVGREAFDLHRGQEALVDEAYELYFAEEREEEQRLWDRIKNEYMRHGLAAVGPTDVLAAVQQGRVDALLVSRNADVRGTQCRECGATVHGTPQTCQSCGSSSVFEVDLVDGLAKECERTSATIEFCDEIEGLQKSGGVAALLRY